MRRWIALCLPLLLLALCSSTANPNRFPASEVVEPNTEDDTVTVSTAAELNRVIAPDAHILLKPGADRPDVQGTLKLIDRMIEWYGYGTLHSVMG